MENIVGSAINEKRLEIGLSINELARLSGVDRTTISKIESGETKNPLIITLNKIFGVLDMDIYDVMEENLVCENCKRKEMLSDLVDDEEIDGKYIKFEIKFSSRCYIEGNDDDEVNLNAAKEFDNAIFNIDDFPEYFLDLIDESSVDISWIIDDEQD